MRQSRQTRMPVNDVYAFADYNRAEVWKEREEVGQGRGGRNGA